MQVFEQSLSAAPITPGKHWFLGVSGNNCAFRRAALLEIGGFDEAFVYYLDETDVCLRLSRAGYQTVQLPDNAIRHYAARAAQSDILLTRGWDVITLSDTYFALKNGADALPRRFAKTLWLAPRKHFFRELTAYILNSPTSLWQRARLVGRYGRGLISGLRLGLFQSRRFGHFAAPPAPPLPFAPAPVERPLHIALLSQTLPIQANYGGIGRYTYDLALGLFESGHEVHVFCKDAQPLRRLGLGFYVHGISPEAAEKYRFPGGAARPILRKNLGHALAVVDALKNLYARSVEFDVVHASNWDAEAAALIRSEVYPVVLFLVTPLAQSVLAEKWPLTDDLRACIALDRWQILNADLACTPSMGVRESYSQLMGIDGPSTSAWRLVSPGIVPESPGLKSEPGRRRLLFVGRLERRKGIQDLLQILPGLLLENPDWECHLVGDDKLLAPEGGTFRERFVVQHAGANWMSRVVFHGPVPEAELRWHYQNCDLFVAPSLFESFGLIYQEAMQYGKAVVGCRVGGVPEVLADGVEGRLVAPGNPTELQSALADLMRDDARRRQMGQAGAERVHKRENYRSMAAGMEQVYRSAIATYGHARRARRAGLWPRDLRLLEPDDRLAQTGDWRQTVAPNGQAYLVGRPGASLQFTTRALAQIQLTTLRHGWSGVLGVTTNAGGQQVLDLYWPSERPIEYADTSCITLGGVLDEPLVATLRVLDVRNPDSYGSEIWLKRLALVENVAGG